MCTSTKAASARAVAEMNYATRRVVEVQAPWISGDRR
jgi:hypothetical protein